MNEARIVVGLGEVLWDVFPDGPRFGGAPANFACHAAQLGADARMASAVGNDELGNKALKALQEKQVKTDCVRQMPYPTGTVTVQLDEAGKASYEFAEDTAWDHLEWSEDLANLAKQSSAVCFGTLGQRSETSRKTIQRFVKAVPAETSLRVFDINLRPPFYTEEIILESLRLANVLKLNDDELPILAKLCELSGTDVEIMRELSQRYGLRLVALTRGNRGAVLCRDGKVSESAGVETNVVDTVGAGDSFTAALVTGLLEDRELDEINKAACKIAAYVCSQPGATPRIPDHLKP